MPLKYPALLMALLLTAGCAGIGAPFVKMRPDYSTVPETALRAAAHAVESAVAQGERAPDLASFAGVSLDTPAVKQAIRARAARVHLVQQLLSEGYVYEQKSGTIATRRTREYRRVTNRQQRDQHALLVMNENQDRWALYEGMVNASKWSPKALSAVQRIFFEARFDQMAQGQFYEDADGNVGPK